MTARLTADEARKICLAINAAGTETETARGLVSHRYDQDQLKTVVNLLSDAAKITLALYGRAQLSEAGDIA